MTMHAGREESFLVHRDLLRIGAGAIRRLQRIAAAVVEKCEPFAVW